VNKVQNKERSKKKRAYLKYEGSEMDKSSKTKFQIFAHRQVNIRKDTDVGYT
jgi:hypothetical protein